MQCVHAILSSSSSYAQSFQANTDFKYIDKGTVALDFQNFICVQFRKLQNSSKSLYPTGVTGLAFSRDLKCVTLKRVVACSPNYLPRCRIRTGDPLPCWSLNYCTSSVGLTS